MGITTRKNGFKGRYSAKGEGIERVYNYLNNSKNTLNYYNVHLYNSIKKHGFKSFEVIEELDVAYSKEELLNKERYWINYYKSNDYTYGYNCTSGGEELHGGNQNFISKIKRKITKATRFNTNLTFWYGQRMGWDNPFLYIWDYDDGLTHEGKKLLYHKLKGYSTKYCKICGIEYYRSGKGCYCKSCGETDFLNEYKNNKKIIKILIIK